MPRLRYDARTATGLREAGVRDASSETALLRELRGRGLVVLRIDDADRARADADNSGDAPRFSLPPRSLDVELALQQLALLLRSGLPLLSALRTCADQSARPALRRVLRRVAERIQEGSSLHEAFGEHPCFPRLVTALTEVGEQTGTLDAVLERAAQTLERRRLLATSVKTALTYPAIVVVLAIGVVAYMTLALIPKLEIFLTAFGRRLPPLTQALLDVSRIVRENLVPGAVLLVLLIAGWIALRAWPPGRRATDRLALRVPVLGRVLRLAATAQFARTLGTLVRSGVRLTEALRVASRMATNSHVAAVLGAARERVLAGSSLAAPLRADPTFPPLLGQMVAVGESAGTLDSVLEDVARFHETQLDVLIRRLSALLEPVVIVVVGGIVAFVYLACFMAIYAIAGNR